jgi:hypothetical protein
MSVHRDRRSPRLVSPGFDARCAARARLSEQLLAFVKRSDVVEEDLLAWPVESSGWLQWYGSSMLGEKRTSLLVDDSVPGSRTVSPDPAQGQRLGPAKLRRVLSITAVVFLAPAVRNDERIALVSLYTTGSDCTSNRTGLARPHLLRSTLLLAAQRP